MWPRDARNVNHGRRRRRTAALRALMCAVCLLGGESASRGQGGAAAADDTRALRERDVRRAERVLEKLGLLGEAGAAREGEAAFRGLARKLYPGLFITVADMRPRPLTPTTPGPPLRRGRRPCRGRS